MSRDLMNAIEKHFFTMQCNVQTLVGSDITFYCDLAVKVLAGVSPAMRTHCKSGQVRTRSDYPTLCQFFCTHQDGWVYRLGHSQFVCDCTINDKEKNKYYLLKNFVRSFILSLPQVFQLCLCNCKKCCQPLTTQLIQPQIAIRLKIKTKNSTLGSRIEVPVRLFFFGFFPRPVCLIWVYVFNSFSKK